MTNELNQYRAAANGEVNLNVPVDAPSQQTKQYEENKNPNVAP